MFWVKGSGEREREGKTAVAYVLHIGLTTFERRQDAEYSNNIISHISPASDNNTTNSTLYTSSETLHHKKRWIDIGASKNCASEGPKRSFGQNQSALCECSWFMPVQRLQELADPDR
jgi:hypothetical protein